MAETITRAQLSESIYQEVGLSRNESADLLEMVLAEITQALLRSETVKISSFGSFSVRQKGQRVGRNPKTGANALAEIQKPATKCRSCRARFWCSARPSC